MPLTAGRAEEHGGLVPLVAVGTWWILTVGELHELAHQLVTRRLLHVVLQLRRLPVSEIRLSRFLSTFLVFASRSHGPRRSRSSFVIRKR